ncbi:EpsG family protein [Vibrio alginolyticus]|uniref:EpsG family protein n=1 Tax=Vibrio alginolyticus TaxID=663 RepID=UPI003C71B691
MVLLSLFSALQSVDVSYDREAYVDFFSYFSNVDYQVSDIEPAYYYLFKLGSINQELEYVVFFILCFLGLAIKWRLFMKHAMDIPLAVAMFMSYLFFLQDMNQIRIGVAIGLFYLSIISYFDKKYFAWLFFALMSSMFHYSTLIAFLAPFFVFRNIKSNTLYVVMFFVIFLSIIWSSLNVSLYLLKLVSLFDPTGKITTYLAISSADADSISPIKRLLPHLVFLVPLVWKFELITRINRYYKLFILMYILYVISFLLLSAVPTIAYRISDIFLFASIFCISSFPFCFKSKLVVRLICYLYCALQVFYVVHILQVFEVYTFLGRSY